ncbi:MULTISPECIES: hypothetical protein [unclassified Aureimonas]|uniref:hypothetical protein n=1 Tax=unclassified Aureimonas TaxID=2615206 RepID=UPI0012E3DA45|nr:MULTISPECIES: hypothetical protein [unclassified Aureimonas]
MPVEVAREIVLQGIADLERGIELDKAWVGEARKARADRIGVREPEPDDGPLTWGRAQREYLDDLRNKGRSDRTVDDYAGILRSLSVLDDRQLSDLTVDDFRLVLVGIASDRPSTSFRATEVARSVSRWLSASGHADDFLADLTQPPGAARSVGRQARPPATVDQIAEIVRRCRDGSVSASIAHSIEVVCLTGFRVGQIVVTRPADVRDGLWFIPGSPRREGYCLPLTRRLQTLIDVTGEWSFPEVYTRNPDEKGHVTEASVIIALRRIGGTTSTGIRAAIAGALSDAGYSNSEIDSLYERVSWDPVDEAVDTAKRGQMLRTWGDIVEGLL